MVYFIQAEIGGPVKIGYTGAEDVGQRLRALQAGCPVPLRVVHTRPGGPEEEQRLHKQFAADRMHGEWFAPTAEIAALIRADLPQRLVVEGHRLPDRRRRMPRGGWWPLARRLLPLLTAEAERWWTVAELRGRLGLPPATGSRVGQCLAALRVNGWTERGRRHDMYHGGSESVWRLLDGKPYPVARCQTSVTNP